MKKSKLTNGKNQQGITTIVMATMLILTVSIMSIYTAQSGIVEQKISSNYYNLNQAFEAAQSGLDIVTDNISVDLFDDIITHHPKSNIATESDFNFALNNSLFKLNSTESTNTIARFQIEAIMNNEKPNTVTVNSFGFSEDNASEFANVKLSQKLILLPLIHYQPPASVIAKKSISIGDKTILANNDSQYLNAAWSGGNIKTNLGGKTAKIDITSFDKSKSATSGLYAKDKKLQSMTNNEFFELFFVSSKSEIKKKSHVISCTVNCSLNDIELARKDGNLPNIIWVDAKTTEGKSKSLVLNKVSKIGSIKNPVLLIIDGDLVLNNTNLTITGIVYTTQSLAHDTPKAKIIGSYLTEKNLKSKNDLQIHYSNTVLRNLIRNTSEFVKIAGSWKDF